MGTGKSTVGEKLAGMLGLDFLDTDHEIETKSGRSIADIFENDGEPAFRQMERQLCETLGQRDGVVIATGGGTLVDEANYRTLSKNGDVFLLETAPDVLVARLESNVDRPLLGDGNGPLAGKSLADRIQGLLEARADAFARVTHRIDTSRRSPDETAALIATQVSLPRETLVVNPVGGGVPQESLPTGRFGLSRIDIGRGLLGTLGARLRELELSHHAFLLMPDGVRKLFLDQIAASLEADGIPYSVIGVTDGDAEKNVAQTQRLLDELIDQGARRDAVVIPVGGGVTGDIGGFAASLFMRGVPLVQIPTTLLAQVDSSIGGKVGVNHALAKNLIGAFYQPHLVVNDPCTLRTLPVEEVANGMAEVVKAALIDSLDFFEFIERETETNIDVRYNDTGFLETCVAQAARIKTEIVNEDPYERDRRRLLNLGHTVGHALEASSRYAGLKHGQAVSLGIVIAYQIAADRGAVAPDVPERVTRVLANCLLPTTLDAFDADAVAKSMGIDKKIKRGRLHYVLPTGDRRCEGR